jgi:ubiquinone/menaquinone biosynthesis C-methylase UbiE
VSPFKKMKLLKFSLVMLLSVASGSMALSPKFSNKVAAEHVSNSRKFTASSTSLKTASVNENGSTKMHQAIARKKWGVDNDFENEYWFDQRIHTLGNSGFGGAVHAAVAAFSTKIIDFAAYDGVDIRREVADELAKSVKKSKAKVLDLCCGVGMSTRALREAFPDAETVMGVDTSPEMVAMAAFLTSHICLVSPLTKLLQSKVTTTYMVLKEQGNRITHAADKLKATTFARCNAENTRLPSQSFDLVTVMYAFHEAPREGREKILQEARRLLQPGGTLAIVDISTDYEPSPSMLMGEPYVLEYQRTIHHQLQQAEGFRLSEFKSLVPGHVGMWLMKRAPAFLPV